VKTRLPLLILAAGSFLPPGGCSDSKHRPVYAVEGIVRYRGNPVEGARVMLYPEEQSKDRYLPNGITGSDGKFKLTTYQTDDGAPAGRYKVSIAWTPPKAPPSTSDPAKATGGVPSKAPEADRLHGKYGDPKTSGLTAEIKADGPNKLEFNLK